MSGKVCGAVWDAELDRPDKLVLQALADHADHDGTKVFPSIGLIAWKTGYNERQVRRLIRSFEERGILAREDSGLGGRGKTTHYRIVFEALPKRPPYDPKKADIIASAFDDNNPDIQESAFIKGNPDIFMSPFIEEVVEENPDILNTNPGHFEHQNPDILNTKGDIAMSPEPSLEPSKNRQRTVIGEKSPKRATSVPETYEPTPTQFQWAWEKHGLQQFEVEDETEQFLNHHRAKGSVMKDWDAAWRTWMGNVRKFQPRSSGGIRKETIYDRNQRNVEIAREMLNGKNPQPENVYDTTGVVNE